MSHIGSLRPDYLVAETGASPLEPYNVGPAMDELGDNIACILLAASDPYAVVGVENTMRRLRQLRSEGRPATLETVVLDGALDQVQPVAVAVGHRVVFLPDPPLQLAEERLALFKHELREESPRYGLVVHPEPVSIAAVKRLSSVPF